MASLMLPSGKILTNLDAAQIANSVGVQKQRYATLDEIPGHVFKFVLLVEEANAAIDPYLDRPGYYLLDMIPEDFLEQMNLKVARVDEYEIDSPVQVGEKSRKIRNFTLNGPDDVTAYDVTGSPLIQWRIADVHIELGPL